MERVGMIRGAKLWIPEKGGKYELGEIVRRDGSMLKVKMLESDKSFNLDMDDPDIALLKANQHVVGDMTSLRHLHLPGILHNLRERSLTDEPYTFLGANVLVAVNPLREVKDPANILGNTGALNHPHPYAIAEGAFQLMSFGASHRKGKQSDSPVNQSILVSGESGAGKTESSKMVLRHLVARCVDSKKNNNSVNAMDRRLLDTNPILESFGNAATKRNHNSSRFGKFLKLHFTKAKRGRDMMINGASVETYLLERSRVTSHGDGERGYHVFYQLVAGCNKSQKDEFKLDQTFKLLLPRKSPEENNNGKNNNKAKGLKRNKSARQSSQRLVGGDKKHFKQLCDALESIGVGKGGGGEFDQTKLFSILAGLLHLSNVNFVNDESSSEGAIAMVENESSLQVAGDLLGIKPKKLKKLFIERKVVTVGEEIITKRTADGAHEALEAVIKTVYVYLFDWLVMKISKSLSTEESSRNSSKTCFIGVLDIFGFETFAVNDFEQLLINYTNEALQITFNKQVFEAEADLYEREGLLIDRKNRAPPVDNLKCLELLRGVGKKDIGILSLIDAEGKAPQPLDDKMNAALHRTYKKHPNFITPHPRDIRSTFIIKHFAGDVKYTVGNFLQKNSDKVPHEVDALFLESSNDMVKLVFERGDGKPQKRTAIQTAKRTIKGMNSSIISKFKSQMDQLVTTLEKTRCSFIRCVKPNPHLLRESGSGGEWFDDGYVVNQLENLSVPQTTQVLQGGLPTRIQYEVFLEEYSNVLPKDAMRIWETLGRGDEREFSKALFYAYDVPRTNYKLGLTRAFFESNMLDRINEILAAGSSGNIESSIVKRFRSSFARSLWRKAIAKVIAVNFFIQLLRFSRERNSAVTILQRLARRQLSEMKGKTELARLREEKRKQESKEAARRAKEIKKKQKEAHDEAERAAAQKSKDAELLRLEEARIAEQVRIEEEKAIKAQEEGKRAKEKRTKLEKEVKKVEKREKDETQRTIDRLGGEDAYRAQKKREHAIKFNDIVKVKEFQPYLTDDLMMEPDPAMQYGFIQDDPIILQEEVDLAEIANKTKVISKPIPAVQFEDPNARRRSVAFPLVDPKKQKEVEKMSKLVSEHAMYAYERLVQPENHDNHSPIKPQQPQRKKKSGLMCFLGGGGNSSSSSQRRRQEELAAQRRRQQQQQQQNNGGKKKKKYIKIVDGKKYEWKPCFVELRGFRLRYFQDYKMDHTTKEFVGTNEIGSFDVAYLMDLDRFTSLEENQRFGKNSNVDPTAVLRLVHRIDANLVFRFQTPKECNAWAQALDNSLTEWKESIRAARKFNKGQLNDDAMAEYKEMLDQGIISKKDYKFALSQQVTQPMEYIEQEIAIYGVDQYDRRVICDNCREVNFLVDDSRKVYNCHECGRELYPPGEAPPIQLEPLIQPVSISKTKSSLSLSRTSRRSKKNRSSNKPTSAFPISVSTPDGLKLTVNQGDMIRSPRFDVKTQQRQYYYAFRCQLEDSRDKRNIRYWEVDYPYSQFHTFSEGLKNFLESQDQTRLLKLLPKFPQDRKSITDVEEVAKRRVEPLNQFMEKLLLVAQAEPYLFTVPPMRFFFNLASIPVSPLTLEEMNELKPTFRELEEFVKQKKAPTEEILSLFESVQGLYHRLEACTDEDAVFNNTTDSAIASLSFADKGRIYSLASEYLGILEAFREILNHFISKIK